MDNLFELLSRLFENNNVAGIIIAICLLLTLLSNISFFSFLKRILKSFFDLFYGLYWNRQRQLLNKPLTDKQKEKRASIKKYLLDQQFVNENPDNRDFYYHVCLPGLNESLSVTIGKTHSYICTSKNVILTRTGSIDNQYIDNKSIIQLLDDLMKKGPNNLNRADYILQQEELKEPKICKKCKYFICSGWNM